MISNMDSICKSFWKTDEFSSAPPKFLSNMTAVRADKNNLFIHIVTGAEFNYRHTFLGNMHKIATTK